ncbi:hypothetical protein [Actinoplanes sp. NPDC051859]|uniref:BP74-related protein n=1 Tax=Actinoplanes sp. NPDC051859 TaxID=3363909 RepID=UPI0037B0CF8C
MRSTMKVALAALVATAGLAAAATPVAAATTAPAPRGGYIATVQMPTTVAGEKSNSFRVQLVDREDIQAAFAVLRGESNAHVNGKIVWSKWDKNSPWGWHLDPNDVTIADRSMELCDGRPAYLEAGWWNSERFCPWKGKVVKMERVRS